MRLELGVPARANAEGKGTEVRRRYNRVPYLATRMPSWSFIDKHCPGASATWERDVGLPADDFTIGITGGGPTYPQRVVATTRDWTSVPVEDRKRFEYLLTEKLWRQTHP